MKDLTEHEHALRAQARRMLGLPVAKDCSYQARLDQIEAMQLKGKALHAEAKARGIVGRSSMKAQVLRTAVFFAREKQEKEAEYQALCVRWFSAGTLGPIQRLEALQNLYLLYSRTHPELKDQVTAAAAAALSACGEPARTSRYTQDNYPQYPTGIISRAKVLPTAAETKSKLFEYQEPEKKHRYRDPKNKEKQTAKRRKRRKMASNSARKNRR